MGDHVELLNRFDRWSKDPENEGIGLIGLTCDLAAALREVEGKLATMTDLRDRAVAEGLRIGAHEVQVMVRFVDPLKRQVRDLEAKVACAVKVLSMIALDGIDNCWQQMAIDTLAKLRTEEPVERTTNVEDVSEAEARAKLTLELTAERAKVALAVEALEEIVHLSRRPVSIALEVLAKLRLP